ncbi:MAG: heat-shock protein [Gammaproteobacteria bacterium]|nr:heat-shock protein [Gammaproteobacteria bacterium]|tara:strand:+ start:367 stop:810 length:444 start_codon:yes stop_codon:yes gene_type:complete
MTLDLSSLFHATIGFDQLNRIYDDFSKPNQLGGYPPYNILKIDSNLYRLSMAVAGFSIGDITITLDSSTLNIKSDGKKYPTNEVYLYKGIAYRAFEKKFRLAENIRISGAFLNNGLLDIDLVKVTPVKRKPEEINILASRPLIKKKT